MTTISIVTCVLGEPEALLKTAESIKPYLCEKIKWVIKFSEKSSKDFIESFRGPYIQTHQIQDRSLYDAINQALSFCEGEFYMVLGAGDMLLPEGMRALQARMHTSPIVATSFHAPIVFSITGAVSMPQPEAIKYFMSCPHPSTLLRVKNSLAIGGFDSRYQIAADYDHLCRYAKAFGSGEIIDGPPLVSFMGGGLSDTRALEGFIEENLIRIRIWGAPDIRILGDLLNHSAINISSSIRHNFP